MSGFLVYLCWGRTSTLGYFAARALMVIFIFATIFFAPAVNPLQLLYRLNYNPYNQGHLFAVYMTVVLLAIFILVLVNNALVKQYINKKNGSKVQGSGFKS